MESLNKKKRGNVNSLKWSEEAVMGAQGQHFEEMKDYVYKK